MITSGSILNPSEVNLPSGETTSPVYLDLNTSVIPDVKIRALYISNVSDAQVVYITDTGTVGGNELFKNILFAQISIVSSVYGDPSQQYTCSVEILSNISIKIGFASIVFGSASGDVSVLLIGD
jgi:hypothetical protein